MGKKIISIKTWACTSVALCSDGTIWEARPEFDIVEEGDGVYVKRISKMNWYRINGVDINEPKAVDEREGGPELMKCPSPAEVLNESQISHLRPKEAEGLNHEIYGEITELKDKNRDAYWQRGKGIEFADPEWLMEIRKRDKDTLMSSEHTITDNRKAYWDRSDLLKQFDAAKYILKQLAREDRPLPKEAMHEMACSALLAMGFKKI